MFTKSTHNDMVYSTTGNSYIVLGYWSRQISDRNTNLSDVMYHCLLQLDMLRLYYTSTWVDYIRTILNECAMWGICLSHNVYNTTWFKKTVEMRLKDQWMTTWHHNVSTKTLCNNHNMFEVAYVMEVYLVKLPKSNSIL